MSTASPATRRGVIDLGDQQLEMLATGPLPAAAPTLVMLHEGLGSAELWGEVPERLASVTGLGVVAYSRAGLGGSSPKPLPWPSTFMHDEATEVLPRVLDSIGFRRGLLVGASDGSSIATIHAGAVRDPRVAGISITAPHFIVEDATEAGARAARIAYDEGKLKRSLSRWHKHVETAFFGWNNAFSDPDFKRSWSIVEELGQVRVPIQILQGEDDQYGTSEQLAIARRVCQCPLETRLFPGIGHSLHREAPALMVECIADFAQRVLA